MNNSPGAPADVKANSVPPLVCAIVILFLVKNENQHIYVARTVTFGDRAAGTGELAESTFILA